MCHPVKCQPERSVICFGLQILAKEKPDDGTALFRNKHFEDIFLYHDNVNIALYEGLAKGSAKGLAMEEFLIAIHKKVGIHITAG